jgi:transcriptional regulator with GAF, ATPase, and Fis domain
MRNPSAFAAENVVVGTSPRMRAVFDFVRVIADSHSNVLVTGESGTGKEVIANMIHDASPRRHRPFIAVSCALFSENLIETELFGHERGAFTGAIREKAGRFELAQGGTIFLDDIDDVPPSMQVKLLRVIQTRIVERVGGTRTIPVDVRIITGSKRDLRQLVAEGKFREDLFYRLNVLPIVLPPLRERREDIPALTDAFLRRFFRQRGEDMPEVSPVVRQIFKCYDWPGNVRELENACERIAQTSTCGAVRVGCLAASLLFQTSQVPRPVEGETERPVQTKIQPVEFTPAVTSISLDDRLREVEANLITWALGVTTGNKSKAAELLKIKRSTLGDRIQRCGLHIDDDETTPPADVHLAATA